MFNFKADYSNTDSGFAPLPEGNYECVIQQSHEKVTKNNKESLAFKLVVRNDLDVALPETNGAYKNRILFDDQWKITDDNGDYVYNMKNIMMILEAVGIPEGTEINGMDALHEMLRGKPVKVFTKVEPNTYLGETTDENTIAPWGYSPTDFPNVQHVGIDNKDDDSNPYKGTEEKTNLISDDDIPF